MDGMHALDPDRIVRRWQEMLATGEHLHAPDIARRLQVSEAALVSARIGQGATRLKPDAAGLLAEVSRWGRVLMAFSNASGVHMPLGAAEMAAADGVLRLTGDHMAAELDPAAVGEAFLFLDRDDNHGNTRSLQFFTAEGKPIVKVFIFHKSRFAAMEAHFAAHTAADQTRLSRPQTAAPAFDPLEASLAADPDRAPEPPDLPEPPEPGPMLEAMFAEGGPARIEAVCPHARIVWSGTLSGLRFGGGMVHLHESDLRSHLRLAPLTRASRTASNALAFADASGRLLSFRKGSQ